MVLLDYFSYILAILNVLCVAPFAVRRFRGHHRQLLIEFGRNVEEGMKRLEEESEDDYVR